jgi:hypothetical protein
VFEGVLCVCVVVVVFSGGWMSGGSSGAVRSRCANHLQLGAARGRGGVVCLDFVEFVFFVGRELFLLIRVSSASLKMVSSTVVRIA